MSLRPLEGVRILDFSTLVPGPFATLMLAEAGADVIKIERPPVGDPMRARDAEFAMLNAGKRSLFVDLKDASARERLMPMIEKADVIVEQFRPGVMDRLGLGAAALMEVNPRLIYCSINSYGSEGPQAQKVGHDLTFAAESGLLMQTAAADGAPVMPPAMIADIGGGAYPAVINILLALLQRERNGKGSRIDVAMADNVQSFLYPAYVSAFGEGRWRLPNDSLESGVSPRYTLYRTADGRSIAAAPVEEAFWRNFCAAIDLPELADVVGDDAGVKTRIAARIAERDAAVWTAKFEGVDTACALVLTFEEAMKQRGMSDTDGAALPPLPLPIAGCFAPSRRAPRDGVERLDNSEPGWN